MLLNRKLAKSVSAVSGSKSPGGKRAGCSMPDRAEKGIHEYVRLAGAVYSIYRTTTHKYLGLALYNGTSFEPCDVQTLITALESERR